ncbi:MAG: bifunctional metallophosphatase/5'-nucleotidase [Methylophilus sp.]|uniref:bifunctional metallophosphatase/5'-nucleotidase n=1 Tax=Methylophilus sp. TaxID=29541 RepID=UPI003FA17D4B
MGNVNHPTQPAKIIGPWRALLACACLLFCAHTFAEEQPAPGKQFTISVLSTTDLHGHLETLPRIAGFISNVRKARAADGGAVLVLDGGDMFQGELASNLNEGAAVVAAYNQIGYDAVTMGNHEFDFGPTGPAVIPKKGQNPRGALQARAAEAHYPFLAANTIEKATGEPLTAPNIKPSVIVDVHGIKVGLIGVLTLEATQSILIPVFDGLKLSPLDEAIRRQALLLRDKAKAIKAQGATIVIAVAHAGGHCSKFDNPDDLSSCDHNAEIFEVARKLEPGLIDAIVGGHTHQKVAHRVNGIPIIQAGKNGETLARLDLAVDVATGKVFNNSLKAPITICKKSPGASSCENTSYEGQPVIDDLQVANIVEAAFQVSNARRNELVGVDLLTPIERAKDKNTESALANLVADLMRKARPVDIAITHAGGLRADLPAGPLKYGSLYETYPRDSTFAIASLSGRQLKAAIAKNLSGPTGLLFSISGARVQAECKGNELAIAITDKQGKPIADETTIVVATNTLLALGSEGTFGNINWAVEDDPPIREAIIQVLKSQGGSLTARDVALYDVTNPRISIAQPLPVKCTPQGVHD